MLTKSRLDEALAAFLEGGRTIWIAACGAECRPAVGRALGCRIATARDEIAIYIGRSANADLLDVIADGGGMAATFTEPLTHRSIQLKGRAVRIGSAADEALETVERCAALLGRELVAIGYAEGFVRTLLSWDPGDIVEVVLRPDAVFDQTPGPNAGAALA